MTPDVTSCLNPRRADAVAAILIAVVAALALDASTLWGFFATLLLVLLWVSFRLTHGWPMWLRIIAVGGTFLVPIVGFLILVVARWRWTPANDRRARD